VVSATRPGAPAHPIRAALCLAAALFAASLSVAQSTTPPTAPDKPAAPLTKAQAKQLLASVDEILAFVSKDTGLPITRSVKRKLVSREEVTRYLQKKFDEDESTKRIEHGEIVLKKFGLLDRDFQLRPFLIALLTEQIAGFYDEKTRTVNLLDYVEPDEQKPVLAHELTHALQDMKVDLVKWSDLTPEGNPKNVREDNLHIQTDESGSAREAVTEGQAMVTFLDYSVRATGKTLADAPELGDRLRDTVGDSGDSPIMARAPLLLQKTLIFPYAEGLSFESAVLAKRGREGAFAGTLTDPPSSTFEIIHPTAYLNHVPPPVLPLPNLRPLLEPNYSFYDLGVMGELDVRILMELFGGADIAKTVAPEWAGGDYYAVQRNDAPDKNSPASIALIYFSRWKNRDSARTFLRIYANQLARKYSGLVRRKQDETDDSEQVYSTTEGDVLLSIHDSTVYAFEGFPLAQARTLRDAIANVQGTGPILQAATPSLTQPLTHLASKFTLLHSGMLPK
jgi:hypothetical protein